MAFIRKLPDTPERLEHLKGGAGHLERYALLSPEEMRLMADIAKEHGLFLISDEVYREFCRW